MISVPHFVLHRVAAVTRAVVAGITLTLLASPCFASRMITDGQGRKVSLPDSPQRIICLTPALVDDVYALGGGDQVVGITNYVLYPAAAVKKPSVGQPLSPSVEAILALHPDLVLATPVTNEQPVLDVLERNHIAVVMVDPRGLQGILESITLVGSAIHRQREAQALRTSLSLRIDRVRNLSRGKQAISVFMPLSYEPVITIGRGAFITEMIEAAGAHSVTSDIPQEWPQISIEAVIARAPQALVLERDAHVTLATLAHKAGWSGIPAVQNRRAYFVDQRFSLPSPVAIDALEDLARQIHPKV